MSAGKMLHTGTFVCTQSLKNEREHWEKVVDFDYLCSGSASPMPVERRRVMLIISGMTDTVLVLLLKAMVMGRDLGGWGNGPPKI